MSTYCCIRAIRKLSLTKIVIIWLILFAILIVILLNKTESIKVMEEIDTETESAIDIQKLDEIIKCDNKNPVSDIRQQQDFWVLENFVLAERKFNCHETVTLTTQADYSFLDNLVMLVEKWNGPISVALYSPGDDFKATLESIAYLRNCETTLVRQLVTFHLFFDTSHYPKDLNTTIQNSYIDQHDCLQVPFEVTHESLYKQRKNMTYPINVARNLARRTATTHFIFPSDIELYPTRNFIHRFLEMISKDTTLSEDSRKVFVLALFELVDGSSIPETKTQLQKMLREKTAFTFHRKVCTRCHKIPEFDNWVEQSESDTLSVFASVKRLGKHREWEPFFVGTNSEPWFDERLTWEGQANKMTQGFIMCTLDYDYLVLDNAFLVHKPGIKKKKVQALKHKDLIRKTNRLIKGQIKYELIKLYGYREDCQWNVKPKPKSKN